MSIFKKHQILLLPTNEKASIVLHKNKNILEYVLNQSSVIGETEYFSCQHLYILSDEEIKEGDFGYNTVSKTIDVFTKSLLQNKQYYKKIICATDKSLTINSIYGINSFDAKMFGGNSEVIKLPQIFNLPQPCQSFIEHFVSEYNKGNIITDVMVECELCDYDIFSDRWKLKINSDNTIKIKPNGHE